MSISAFPKACHGYANCCVCPRCLERSSDFEWLREHGMDIAEASVLAARGPKAVDRWAVKNL